MKKSSVTKIMTVILTFLLICTTALSVPETANAAAKPKKLTLSAAKQTIYVGKSITLKVKKVTPKKASKAVTYKSSNSKVAAVNAKGKVTGKKAGKAVITVTSKVNKKVKAKCTVIVKQQVKKITVTNAVNNQVAVRKGKTLKLKISVSPSNASSKKMKFSTSNKKIATVDSKGKIKAKKKTGTAKITVKAADGKGAKAVIKVIVPKTEVKSVKLNMTSKSLDIGGTTALKASVVPQNATVKVVSYQSSNSKVATVNAKGTVKAAAPGTATITAVTLDGNKKASCKITVKPKKVSSVTVSPAEKTLKVGEAFKATVKVAPSDAGNKKVNWSSSNTKVAAVDTQGNVKAVAQGTAVITATAADGSGKSGSCTVTVTKPVDPEVKVTSVTVTPDKVTLKPGETSQLQAAVAPENASNKAVKWSSDKTAVATVDERGKVTAVAEGTAVITATAADGSGKSASCTITVSNPVVPPVEATAITLDKTELNLKVNEKVSLTATVAPADAKTSITWTTSDKKVANVDAAGEVTAVAEGTATITAATDNGLEAACKVTVVERANALTEDANNYIYTLDKNAVTYDAIRNDITHSLSVEAVAADEAWFAQKAASMEWNNATLKNNWRSISTDTVMRISQIAQELFLDRKLEITASSDTALTIRVTRAGRVQTVLVERTESQLGKSSLTITNQSTGKKIYVKEITVKDNGKAVQIAAQVSGEALDHEMSIIVDFTKDGKSASLKKLAGGIEVPVITYESTEDAYVFQISKVYYGELLNKFEGSSVVEDFVNTTQVFNVYTEY